MRELAAMVFPGFQTFDLFGPVALLGDIGDQINIKISIVAEILEPAANHH